MTAADAPATSATGPGRAHLVLMGLRGSGKSTLGPRLGAALGRPFIDLDDRTRALLGAQTVAQAWASRGETEFRRAEARALRECLDLLEPHVIALGGGTPTAPGASGVLTQARRSGRARLVYLRAAPAELRRRLAPSIAADPDRPALIGKDPLAEIDDVFTLRDGLYRALADRTLDVDGLSIDGSIAAVLGAAG